jgi:hypothetical protein
MKTQARCIVALAIKTKASKLDELTAQVAALTAENEKLKASPPPAAPAKGKH